MKEARERGKVLRYVARAKRGGVRVGLVGVPIGSAARLASTAPTTCSSFTTGAIATARSSSPGPGAGAEVTAAGVLGDLLRMVAA